MAIPMTRKKKISLSAAVILFVAMVASMPWGLEWLLHACEVLVVGIVVFGPWAMLAASA